MTETRRARVTIVRRVEWMDTDAAGIYHWTTVFRFAEAAEAALHDGLGIAEITFGATPRVAVSAEFERPLRFNDRVEVELAVEARRADVDALRRRHQRRGGRRRHRIDHRLPHRPHDPRGDAVAGRRQAGAGDRWDRAAAAMTAAPGGSARSCATSRARRSSTRRWLT